MFTKLKADQTLGICVSIQRNPRLSISLSKRTIWMRDVMVGSGGVKTYMKRAFQRVRGIIDED